MRLRPTFRLLACLLFLVGAWLLWRDHQVAEKFPSHLAYTVERPGLAANPSTAVQLPEQALAAQATNPFAFRLSNTTKSIGELVGDSHAILLENALIDTRAKLNFSIPKHLQAQGDAGSYIVQSRGPVSAAFRATLAQSGAQIISYIPNNSYLVTLSAAGADALAKEPLTQAVIPYEPYYKIKSSLLRAAVAQQQLPDQAILTLGLYANGAQQTISQIEKLGGQILAQNTSPFGPVVRVAPPQNWTALATLTGVQIVEPFHRRVLANDLSREALGVAIDSVSPTNYMDLSGSNIIVEVNDSGIDTNHPDFSLNHTGPLRVLGDPINFVDTDGHGTHVAGIIAGDGFESQTVTNAFGSIITNGTSPNFTASPFQFRGKAPLANLFVMNLGNDDRDLQEAAALTNALISNNSWNFDGDNAYDLDAASYDAATRDAMPQAIGSQPVLFVFAAGNAGGGDDSNDPGGGNNDSIESPATAKNVITVGAIQELRNIVVEPPVTNADGSTGQPWQPETSTDFRVAGFSSRGNVGIGTEGQFGRFKPDVVAPGTFVISTRSSEWDITDYFYQSPTNHDIQTYTGIIVQPNSFWENGFPIVPNNAIAVSIDVFANADSPSPFPIMPIYYGKIGSPFPGTLLSTSNQVNIPPDGGLTIDDILNSETFYGFNYAVSNLTTEPISFDLQTDVVTTNAVGDYLLALSNLDNSIGTPNPSSTGPYYRYESGTSMSAADVSGVLALMQDFFVNHSTHTNPSPALLKAMLINGARLTGSYNIQIQAPINFEGWGLVNLPNSLPTAIQTNFNGLLPSSIFIDDQSVSNALATGDIHTYFVSLSTNGMQLPLRLTLAWTDPPGDPAAAIKLVNNLDLVVSNMDTGDTYFGNDIPAGGFFNEAWSTNTVTNAVSVADSINNVENIFLPAGIGTNFCITVIGRDVNVNAVTAQTNAYAVNINPAGAYAPNTVQDYALVVASGSGEVPDAFTITNSGILSTGTTNNHVTYVTSTNSALVNQFVGASSPLIGTNSTLVGTNGQWNPNGTVTLGETNQWHFYVITNNATDNNGSTADVINAAFITFLPPTLSVPRMGVFEDSVDNATRPEADIDLYVTTDSNLLTLDPAAVSNCLNGAQVGASVAGTFNGVALSRGGTEFIVDTNSTSGQVYYVGVKSEDQMASEYDFLSVFSSTPFSQMTNGNEIVNGVALPTDIPDGTPTHPGVTNILGLAIYPIQIGDVIVTVTNTHENFGDLIGTLTFGDKKVVLNNHDALGSIVDQQFIYDDGDGSGTNGIPFAESQPSDGPGSLQSFLGEGGMGVWRLTQVDDSLSQTGSVQNFSMLIEKHKDLSKGLTVTIQPQSWFYTFIDVPAGVTNLTINATNLTDPPDFSNPLQLVVKFGSKPTLTNADKGSVALTNGQPFNVNAIGLTNTLSVGPNDVPPIQPGRYWVGIWNPSLNPQTVGVGAVLSFQNSGDTINFDSTGLASILDDAVSYSIIHVDTNLPIASLNVGIEVQDARISDLIFHLISPDGTRVLLMENRGGADTNGAGITMVVTNVVSVPTNIVIVTTNIAFVTNSVSFTNSFEGLMSTDYVSSQVVSGWTVSTNQVSLVTDTNTVFNGTNFLALATGGISTNLNTIPGQSYTVSFGYRGPGAVSMWRGESNALDSVDGNNGTLAGATTNVVIVWTNGFEGSRLSVSANSYFADGWYVDPIGNLDVLYTGNPAGSTAFSGTNYIDLTGDPNNPAIISTNIAQTIPGMTYTLRFAYARNPDSIGQGFTPRADVCINSNLAIQLNPNQNNSWANLQWQTTSRVFTAISPSTHLVFQTTNYNGSASGVLLDAVSLTTNMIAIAYTNGEVGSAFQFDGSISSLTVPGSANLTVSNLTLEAWIFPNDSNTARPIFDFGGPGQISPVQFWIDTIGGPGSTPGALHAVIRNSSAIGFEVDDANPVVNVNRWNHLALTLDTVTRKLTLYCNGIAVASGISPNPINPQSYANVDLGYRDASSSEIIGGRRFLGALDEATIYNRPLSASEIKAIYNLGSAGKFDSTKSFATNLAEMAVSVGATNVTLFGSNMTWQTFSTTFTATTNKTPFKLTGVEPGILLDFFVMPSVTITTNVTLVTNTITSVAVTNVVTNALYLTFTEDTNLTTTPIKYAEPPFTPDTTTNIVISTNGFEGLASQDILQGSTVAGWTVTTNQVSLMTDTNNALEGSNFLALANGVISNTLPTIAGNTYTLTFAYRGPGIVGMWRGESDANDSIGINNGVLANGASYTNGEVGAAFALPGAIGDEQDSHFNVSPGPEVIVPSSSLWDFGSSNFTIDLWANFNVVPSNDGNGIGYPFDGILVADDSGFGGNNKWWFAEDGPVLDFHINDPNSFGADFTVQAPFTPQVGQWYHLAITRNGSTYIIYTNGVADDSPIADANVIPPPNVPLEIGGAEGFYFNGALDEVSIYQRALSASEIGAIYTNGMAGKFDAGTSFPQNLAEAQIGINGQTPITISGNNTNWQTKTITFTATQNGTPVQITGVEPGMLLDDFVLTQVPADIYYLPEQSLDTFNGENVNGDWTLEMQDTRAGAGLTNTLVSWELQFVFANTNPVPASLGGGIGQSNQFIPAGDIAWYKINVPATANFATNILLSASGSLNIWFDTNSPSTENIFLLSGTSGSVLLSTTNPPDGNLQPPPNIYDGQTYYLGVQNTNNFTVNYGIKVNFDVAGQFSSLVVSSVTMSGSATTLKWTASPSAQFQVQWKDDLTQPWNTDSQIITSSDGNFTFTDDGSQTAALGAQRFYRLVQISP